MVVVPSKVTTPSDASQVAMSTVQPTALGIVTGDTSRYHDTYGRLQPDSLGRILGAVGVGVLTVAGAVGAVVVGVGAGMPYVGAAGAVVIIGVGSVAIHEILTEK